MQIDILTREYETMAQVLDDLIRDLDVTNSQIAVAYELRRQPELKLTKMEIL